MDSHTRDQRLSGVTAYQIFDIDTNHPTSATQPNSNPPNQGLQWTMQSLIARAGSNSFGESSYWVLLTLAKVEFSDSPDPVHIDVYAGAKLPTANTGWAEVHHCILGSKSCLRDNKQQAWELKLWAKLIIPTRKKGGIVYFSHFSNFTHWSSIRDSEWGKRLGFRKQKMKPN